MPIIERVKKREISVGDLVKGKKANFVQYHSGYLHYITEDGFPFVIPLSDTGEGTFANQHSAIELMRWIRKQFDLFQKESQS